ncbi:2-oxoacid:acceptor oxidoreductase family protein [Natranaerofaba carboxydovora]|uniref:2-oxoacid:acceptor oxidoreductase family protein n=1 Tax=Natranaerofaba carboxydovora TaxID=2742683 RepID=UPI001F133E91|nr:2-oxoacid:acceptor oxidoreductase family protein [Natranaerofaba carboxydovora]UMZ73487.1 Pyruvate synthase subunit PorC [Natranaerofaba carboxydovora]
MKKFEMRLSGSGGQGLILAGIILGAAATKEGKNVVQTQSYGPEARGGASKSEVLISDERIDYPKVTEPDFLLALTEEALNKYITDIKEDGMVIVDDSVDCDGVDSKVKNLYSVPILSTAKEKLKPIVANMVALGAIVACSDVTSPDATKEAIKENVPPGTEDLNIKAFEAGYDLGKNSL